MNSIIQDPRAALATGGGTLATSLNLSWIPPDIAKLTSVVGAALSCIMIRYWIQKIRIERRESKQKEALREIETRQKEAELSLLVIELKRERSRDLARQIKGEM